MTNKEYALKKQFEAHINNLKKTNDRITKQNAYIKGLLSDANKKFERLESEKKNLKRELHEAQTKLFWLKEAIPAWVKYFMRKELFK